MIYEWQNSKYPWLILSFTMIFLLGFSHFFLQNYLFMHPCEQCVYIRFAMSVLFICGILALVLKQKFFKIFIYALCFYACFKGVDYSITLDKIHTTVQANNPFSKAPSCKLNPSFALSLPLDELLPSLFKPSGLCGYDAPSVPKNAILSPIQEFFVGTSLNDFKDGFYSNGWYLIPKLKFMNMANAGLLCFICVFTVLFAMFISFFIRHIYSGIFTIILSLLMIFLA